MEEIFIYINIQIRHSLLNCRINKRMAFVFSFPITLLFIKGGGFVYCSTPRGTII